MIERPSPDRAADDVIRAMRSLEESYLIGVEGVTEVWLVRHADVYDTLDDVRDPGLSPRGRRQAARLAERIALLQVAAVYASPSRRARETAGFLRAEVRMEPRLGEALASYGGGRLKIEERSDDIIVRMRAAVDDAVLEHRGKRVVMIGHGIAILNYLAAVMRLDPAALRLYPPYTGVSIVRARDDRRAAATLFDVSHLEAT